MNVITNMEIKKAKSIVFEMLDLCSQLENESFSDTCSGIYNDVVAAKSLDSVIVCSRELMVFVNEAPWEDFDLTDIRDEIETLFNNLLEESDEF